MGKRINLIIFQLNNRQFALPVNVVERVVHAVEINSLPKMPDYLLGIINIHGEITPVINVRILFGLEAKEVELSDRFIIATTSSLKIALLVDSTNEVVEFNENEIVNSDKIMYGKKYIKGVIKLKDGMVLINDIDEFLSPDELIELEAILSNQNKKTQKRKTKPKTKVPKSKTAKPKTKN